MATGVRNRIQVRRGYSMGYTGSPIPSGNTGYSYDPVSSYKWTGDKALYEGEIGYEVDTGKFKIGKKDPTTGNLIIWENLDYAGGGGSYIPDSGIGIYVNGSGDDILYSIIASGDANIVLELSDLSGLIPGTTGTYYTVSLADNLNIDGTIAATGIIYSSGIDLRNITTNITVTDDIGSISAGTTFGSGDSVTEILRQILEKVFEPTIGDGGDVTVSLTNTAAQEVGTELSNFTISASFDRGYIAGTGLGANWNPTANQNPYLGAANNYTIAGVDRDLNTSYNKGTHTVTQGSNSFSIVVDYDAGPTPINSLGETSTTLSAASAGSKSKSREFTGYRGLFYGWSKTLDTEPSSSSDVRGLVANTSDNYGVMINPSTRPYSFTLSIPEGATRIVVAVPSGYNSFGDSISVVNAANLPESYETSTVGVEGANGYTAINYFVHSYIPAGPIDAATTHTITVQ